MHCKTFSKHISTPRVTPSSCRLEWTIYFSTCNFFSFLIPYLIPHYHTNYLPAWVGTNPPRGGGEGSSDFAMKYFINNHKLFWRRLFWYRFCLLAPISPCSFKVRRFLLRLTFHTFLNCEGGDAIKTNRSFSPLLDFICHVVHVVF